MVTTTNKERPILTCKVCKASWLQRFDSEPVRCGVCKSPYWKAGPRSKKAKE